ncbi:aromatic amino acid transaminase [Oligella urethralis]|uniref:Aminotransferase n=2 Tax=Oligella urethralis TaxID=90245 RepID=A0A096AKY3_9BURK|nr:amino acid aminotransferase [Oligella urethralis]KGF31302.1 aromatic amino acid aminotransferase [Oligella urethralis DNF00040]WOS37892.1 Aromatic-amino-acid aminotransferase [Oligella urethralis]SPY06906.1 Aromatic-amino-acid aminotransferase [Oligella urethralis]SUA65924.1 Aromatic-amino-acid aminotransferase [Oligella urethralis]
MSSLYQNVAMAPRDPILGLNEQFNADPRPQKVNLGIGVYSDDAGRLPLLKAVRTAEQLHFEGALPRGYLPIEGLAAYNLGAQKLLLGADSSLIAEGRAITIESIGGTGALKIGADFLKTIVPDATVYISDPSWQNHRAIFENAGFQVATYPYYSAATHSLDFEAMKAHFESLAPRSILILHACCHNPTGVDPSLAQWQELLAIIKSRQLIPFLDIAYQGFGAGLEEDAQVVRLFAESGIEMLVSSSFSKSFSLYGERVGALTLTTDSKEIATKVLSQIKTVIRTNYSNPPTHGATVVASVLNSPELFALWEEELSEMRCRIRSMREQLVQKIKAAGVSQDFSFILAQNGMFSYSGLTKSQVERLREEFGIYAVDSGRICVAALNSNNIDYVAKAIATVL